ncbi:MAG: PilZ domain-containing protein [Spirochaetota bacterium]
MSSDKRKEERVKKQIKSEVISEELISYSSTVDLSSGGIFISTPEPLKSGSEVKLSINSPEGENIEVKGLVRWLREDEVEDGKSGMGIEFINLSEIDKKKIENIIKQ